MSLLFLLLVGCDARPTAPNAAPLAASSAPDVVPRAFDGGVDAFETRCRSVVDLLRVEGFRPPNIQRSGERMEIETTNGAIDCDADFVVIHVAELGGRIEPPATAHARATATAGGRAITVFVGHGVALVRSDAERIARAVAAGMRKCLAESR